MAQKTSVETILEQIEHEISILPKDFLNDIYWSMATIYASLKRIREKAELAEEIHKKEIMLAYNEGDIQLVNAEQFYEQTFKNK